MLAVKATNQYPGLDTVAEIIPEAVDPVEAQLARILPELGTDSLRDALEDQRRRRDIVGRALEAGELVTRSAVVLEMSPNGTLDLTFAEDAFELGRRLLNDAVGPLSTTPALSCVLEQAARRSLRPDWSAPVRPPVQGPEDGPLTDRVS